MPARSTSPSPRELALLEAAYGYALEHGLAELSLRPLASAIGSSPRVLLFLFGSKDGLVRALLARARTDQLAMLEALASDRAAAPVGLAVAVERVWQWLRRPQHRPLLQLWAESYTRSLMDPSGPWSGFAEATVTDWLRVLAACQPQAERDSALGAVRRTLALAALRGCLLDLVATEDTERLDAAVELQARLLRPQ